MNTTCPYCEKKVELIYDEDFCAKEDVNYTKECPHCSMIFIINVDIIFDFKVKKAECLNDIVKHDFQLSNSFPAFLTHYECLICGETKDLTHQERFNYEIQTHKRYMKEICQNVELDKLFISGKITGLNFSEAFNKFELVERKFEKDYQVINPMKLAHKHDRFWKSYMIECLGAMKECKFVYMLKDWQESRGAKIEHFVAQRTNKIVVYQQ